MTSQKLVLTSFRRALVSLEEALLLPEVTDIVRDGTIQRFEYTYELAWKLIRKHLIWLDEPKLEIKGEIFRRGAEIGVIADAEEWLGFHRARNATSHSYNREIAREVYAAAEAFAPVARRLLSKLEESHGSST